MLQSVGSYYHHHCYWLEENVKSTYANHMNKVFFGQGWSPWALRYYWPGALFFKEPSVQFTHSVVSDSATPWTAAQQASLSITNSRSLLKLKSIESVMPSNHLILCSPFILLPSIFSSIRVFSSESGLCIKWLKYWEFQLQHQCFQWIFRTDFF